MIEAGALKIRAGPIALAALREHGLRLEDFGVGGASSQIALWTATMALVGVCLAVAARHLDGNVFWCASAKHAAKSARISA
jgi:hypothetical protein